MMSNRDTKNLPDDANLANTEEILSLPADELISRFGTSTAGLTTEEATKRLETYGSNDVAKREQVSIIIEFLSHFKSPLVIILVIAAIVSGILGETYRCHNYLVHSFDECHS